MKNEENRARKVRRQVRHASMSVKFVPAAITRSLRLIAISLTTLCALLMSPQGTAQTSSGTASTGATLWTTYCSGCHLGGLPTATYASVVNAANSGNVISAAIGTFGMTGALPGGADRLQQSRRMDSGKCRFCRDAWYGAANL